MGSPTDHIAGMGFCHFIIADVEAFHALLFKLVQYVSDFCLSIGCLQLERKENMCSLRRVVAIYKLGRRTRVDDAVEGDEAALR